MGVHVQPFAMGDKYHEYTTKIETCHDFIESLPPEFTHICYFDGRDNLFSQPVDHLCKTFNKFNSPFVFSAEQCCWPLNEPEWRESWPAHPLNRRWLCAGVWMGERSAVLSILKLAKEIRGYFAAYLTDSNATCPDWLADVWKWRDKWKSRFSHTDQWLLQIIALKRLRPMAWDTDYRLFANVSCSDWRLPSPTNRHFHIFDGKCVTKQENSSPSILHFSGPQNSHRGGWAKVLGLD